MDGVLADFHGAVCDLFGTDMESILERHPMPHEYALEKYLLAEPMSDEEMWAAIDREGQFWPTIKPYPWIYELWGIIRDTGLPVIVSTSPGKAPWNTAHKITWLRMHLPELGETDWMIGKHKYLMAKDGHILLDDCEHNTESFALLGGDTILFPQPWNRNFHLIEERIEFTKERLLCKTQGIHQE